VAVSIYKREF